MHQPGIKTGDRSVDCRDGIVCCIIIVGWLELYFHHSQYAYKGNEHDQIATYDLGLVFYSGIRRIIIPCIAFRIYSFVI